MSDTATQYRVWLTGRAMLMQSRVDNAEIMAWLVREYMNSYPPGTEPREKDLPYWVQVHLPRL